MREPDRKSEERLEALREEARRTGRVEGAGVDVAGGPLPPALGGRRIPAGGDGGRPDPERVAERWAKSPGYYGKPFVKSPVWTWEVPLYFFVGGITGMSAAIAASAHLLDADPALVRVAFWTAAAGTPVSAALLIADLGRPARFLNMLRVFKWRSPMSVGAWLLTAFGGAAMPAALLAEWHGRAGGELPGLWNGVLHAAGASAGVLGAGLATYTGVLIGATAIPVWFTHRRLLPAHFGAASLGSAGALLELFGFRSGALAAIGFAAAGAETFFGATSELKPKGAADRALREGRSGGMIRTAALLAGPVALGARVFGWVPVAAVSFLAGSLLSRYGWLEAGRASGRDPEATLAAWGEDAED